MGSWRVYETDIKTLKQQLNIFEEMYGEDTKIRLRHASYYNPDRDGENSCVIAVYGADHVIRLMEEDYD